LEVGVVVFEFVWGLFGGATSEPVLRWTDQMMRGDQFLEIRIVSIQLPKYLQDRGWTKRRKTITKVRSLRNSGKLFLDLCYVITEAWANPIAEEKGTSRRGSDV
jgi:hypothetical protein